MQTKLVFGSITITDSQLYDTVDYLHEWNGDEDYNIGTTASASLTFTTDVTTLSVGNSFNYYIKQDNDSSWRLIGRFNIYALEKVKNITQGERWAVTAYDNICKFDKIIDDWLSSLTYPITLGNMFSSLCTYCGCTADSTTFINSTKSIQNNFTTTNITGRVILEYIGQMAAATIYSKANGNIAVGYYTANATTLDNSKCTAITKSEYTITPIDKLIVAIDENDIGCTSGTGDNTLQILYNPLFFADSVAEIQTTVDNVYNKIHSVVYTPMQISLFQDFGINAGDIITVNGATTYVMTKKITSGGVELTCTGNKIREVVTDNNSAINALRGKYTKIKSDLGHLTIEVGELEGTVSVIDQKTDSIDARVTTAEGDISSLTIQVGQIETKVESVSKIYEQATEPTNKMVGDIWHYTGATTSTMTNGRFYRWDGSNWNLTTDSQVTTNTSTITQQGDKIALVVSSSGGSNVVNSASIVAAINGSESSVKIDADKIQMTGTTTFLTKSAADTYYDANGAATSVKNGLATQGYTTINGGNITTGYISAGVIAAGTITTNKLSVNGQDIGGTDSTNRLNTLYTDNVNFYYGGGAQGEIRYNLCKYGVQEVTSGSVTKYRSWGDIIDNSGGGGSYTAGTGISISSSNVISLYGVGSASTGQVLTKSSSGVTWTTPSSTAVFG